MHDVLQDLKPSHLGHGKVGDHYVVEVFVEASDSLSPVVDHLYVKALLLQKILISLSL